MPPKYKKFRARTFQYYNYPMPTSFKFRYTLIHEQNRVEMTYIIIMNPKGIELCTANVFLTSKKKHIVVF